MYHKQLAKHVTERMSLGASEENIRNELLIDGWSSDDINEAFYYSAYPDKASKFSFGRLSHSRVPTGLVVLFLSIVVGIFFTIFIYYRNPVLNYSISLPAVSAPDKVAFTYGEQPALSDPDFFGKVKQQFIYDKSDFVEVDLSAMFIRVYREGKVTVEVPVNSKGREGSWWETPAGLYKINKKEDRHFSGMGHVWMPWSMNFQGNFYIHGRTYYPDGTLTSKQYTGGCIRLATEDAKKVYDASLVGMPVLVFEHSFSADDFVYKDDVGPVISATQYLSVDLLNNHVFASKDTTTKVSIASITKLMTALIATEYINIDNIATVPNDAIIYTSKARLKVGDKYSVYQLLFPLLTESSNEAAETIARFYGRDNFIRHMNEKAASLGMTNTTFTDPSGASAGNISTAEDLFMLAKYIYTNRSFIFNITSGKTLVGSAYGASGFTDLANFNTFVGNEFFFGGKNGKTTAAQETNIAVFELPEVQTKRPIVIIVLGSANEKDDSVALVNYTLEHFNVLSSVNK